MKNNQCTLPRILITMGEPAGVGPELIVKIAQLQFAAQIVVLANKKLLNTIAAKLGCSLELTDMNWSAERQTHRANHLFIENIELAKPVQSGSLNKCNAASVIECLQRASELALSNQVDALVTAPVHKANLNQEFTDFYGHTEYFANLAGKPKVVMMLATDELRIALATTHIPLNQVASQLTDENLSQVIDILFSSFERLGVENLKVAVAGLNPHAGEEGLLGNEEQQMMIPLIRSMQQQGKNIAGPFPADTLFTPQKRQQYDVFLAMYHDQGLPVVKTLGFGRCANITLGLPYIRTSVDHGTALDIADQFCASPSSLEYAIKYAIEMAAGKLP